MEKNNVITKYNITPFDINFGRSLSETKKYCREQFWLRKIADDMDYVLSFSGPIDFVRLNGFEIGKFVRRLINVVFHLEKFNLFTDTSFYFIKRRFSEIISLIPDNIGTNGDYTLFPDFYRCQKLLSK